MKQAYLPSRLVTLMQSISLPHTNDGGRAFVMPVAKAPEMLGISKAHYARLKADGAYNDPRPIRVPEFTANVREIIVRKQSSHKAHAGRFPDKLPHFQVRKLLVFVSKLMPPVKFGEMCRSIAFGFEDRTIEWLKNEMGVSA